MRVHRVLSLLLLTLGPFLASNSLAVQGPPILDTVDSLFTVGQHDSGAVLVDRLMRAARADKDSVLIGKLTTFVGRYEFTVGRADRAAEILDEARRLAIAHNDTTNWMHTLSFQKWVFVRQTKYAQAHATNELHLQLALKTGDIEQEGWARVFIAFGSLTREDLRSARVEYERAADLFARAQRVPPQITALIGLGRVHTQAGEIGAARAVFKRALAMSRDIGDLAQESHCVNNLGTLEYSHGDMGLAAQYFERSYRLNIARGNNYEAIIPASNVAHAQIYLGRYTDAEAILVELLDTCEEYGFEDARGMILARLGELRGRQRRDGAAVATFHDCLAMNEKLSQKTRSDVNLGLAAQLARMDRIEEAIAHLEESMESVSTLIEPHMGLLLTRLLLRAGRLEEALERALVAEKHAAELDDGKIRAAVMLEVSRCYHALGNLESAHDWFRSGLREQALAWSAIEEREWKEAYRVGLATDFVSAVGILTDSPPDESPQRRTANLFNALQERKTRTLIENITEPRQLADPVSGFHALASITLAELRTDVLQPGEVLIDMSVGAYRTYLFAVTQDSCRMITLPGFRSELADKVGIYAQAMGARPEDSARSNLNILAGVDRSLGQAILGSVSDLVAASSRVIVSPDGFLGALPFGTLRLGAEHEPLCVSKEVQVVPSATVLKWLRSRRATPGEFPRHILAIAREDASGLPGAAREVRDIERGYRGVDLRRGLAEDGAVDFRQSIGHYEVVHVAAHVEVNDERPWHSGILLGAETSAQQAVSPETGTRTLKDVSAAARVSEFTNGVVDEDPYLRAREIAGLHVPARLAVLSGCESALGKTSRGEGVLGLTAAFLSAGVSSVVATLWQVDDATTADLMKVFYRNLAKGSSVAGALREAKLAIRTNPQTAHPFYWAAFVVVGDGNTTVRLTRARSLRPLVFTLLALVLITGLLLLTRSRKKVLMK